jgi:ParB family chromosome partitioning protein
MTMAKRAPYKISGLIKSGAVVPSTSPHAEPEDFSVISHDPILPEEPVNQVTLPDTIEYSGPPRALPVQLTGTGRKLFMIDAQLIDPNPLAPREVYTPEMIRDRAEALRTQGQHDPIHVIPNPDSAGRYIIADGWTRVQACLEHKVLDHLLAEIHDDLTLEQSAWFGYQQNEEREQHCDLDRAMFYDKLITAGESASDVARKAGVSRSQMTFYRAFAKLPPDVIEIVRGAPTRFGANAAYQLCKVAEKVGLRHAVRLAVKFLEENHTYAWLVNQAQGLLEPRTHKQPTASKQVRYKNGYYKQRGDSFEVNISVEPSKRAKFATALEQLLATVAEEVSEDDSPETNTASDDNKTPD